MPVIQMSFDVSGVRRGTSDAVRAMGQLTRAVDKLARDYEQAGRAAAASGRTMSSSFGGAASSIRRVAVELAGLYSAMKVLDKMKGFVERGLEYNATLETSQLTIASIIGAVNDISDAQGRVLQGAEKFQAAEELSKGLLEEMRVLAMEVPASFADIAKGVASIIAPATKAGIALSELPKFTVSAVQAMSAMGLHTMQMRTEIEAILSGNINKVQDVLATNLGITGEMVRNWQKQGTLVQELYKRFEMFNIAGTRALTTWGGLQANMKGALDELAGLASKDLFEKIKNAWADLIEFMLEKGADGKLHIGKDIEGLMRLFQEIEGEIGNLIVDAVKKLMKWIADLNKPENLAAALQTWREFKQSCMDVINKVVEVANSVKGVTNSCIELAGEVKGVVEAFKGIDTWLSNHPAVASLLTGAAVGAVGGGLAGGPHGAVIGALGGAGVAAGVKGASEPSMKEVLLAAKARHEKGNEEVRARIGNVVGRRDVGKRGLTGPALLDALTAGEDGGDSMSDRDILEDVGRQLGREAGATMGAELPKKLETKGVTIGAWKPDTNLVGVGTRAAKLGKPEEAPAPSAAQAPAAGEKKEAAKDKPATKKYGLTPTVPRYGSEDKNKKKPKRPRAPKKSAEQRDAERFAENSARYAAGLERLRNEVDALEKSMQPGLTTYDRMVIKINAEKEAAIKDADVKAQESIRRKECTEAQARETAELEKRRAALEAKQQLEELERQQLQDKVTWYREYAEMTGDSAQAVAVQNMAIDQQARDWVALGIPMDQITERVRRMKNEVATDPLSGLRRGWDSWIAGAANSAQIMESTLTGALDMMSAAFGQFVSNGEVDMESLLNSWINMINQMVIRAAMAGIFNQLGSLFTGPAGGGAGGAIGAAASAISAGVGLLAAHGYAFSGPGLGAFRNQIVSRSTIFGYGRRLTAYAHGGIMGEAGPEAVVPLTRTRGGDLGIQADGMGAGSLAVTLVIEDRTQDGVNAQATGGELDGRQIAVIVQQVEQAMVSRAMNGRSPYTRYMDRSRQLNSAKALY